MAPCADKVVANPQIVDFRMVVSTTRKLARNHYTKRDGNNTLHQFSAHKHKTLSM